MSQYKRQRVSTPRLKPLLLQIPRHSTYMTVLMLTALPFMTVPLAICLFSEKSLLSFCAAFPIVFLENRRFPERYGRRLSRRKENLGEACVQLASDYRILLLGLPRGFSETTITIDKCGHFPVADPINAIILLRFAAISHFLFYSIRLLTTSKVPRIFIRPVSILYPVWYSQPEMAQDLVRFRILVLFGLFGFIALIDAQQSNTFNYDASKPPCCHLECCCSTCERKACNQPPPNFKQQLTPMSNDGKTDGLFQAISWSGQCTCETTSSFACNVTAPNQPGPAINLPPAQGPGYQPGGSYPSVPGSYQTGPTIILPPAQGPSPPGGSYPSGPGGYQTGIVLPPSGGSGIILPPSGGSGIILPPSGGSYVNSGGYASAYVQPVRPNGSIDIWPGQGYPSQPGSSYPVQPPIPGPSYPAKPPTIDITPGCQSPPCHPGGQTPGGQVDIITPGQGWIAGGSQAVNVHTKTVWTKDCNCEISKKTFCKPIVPCPGRPGGGYPLPPPPGSYPAKPPTIDINPGCQSPPCQPAPIPSYPAYPPSYPVNPPSGPSGGEYAVGPPTAPSTQAPPTTTEEPSFWNNTAAVILMIVGAFLLLLVLILGALLLFFAFARSKKSRPNQPPRHSSRRHSVEPTDHQPSISGPQLVSSSQPAVRDYEVGGTAGEYRQRY
ncbi:hypothetical protein DdX_17176 [Ditylenchus destructor]|uniref:Uncharacterized protein n=1 Tax=Ditylenchus destructor TaxID=166010 RepID=A0AAD4MSC2_9BILA|nr:hypothetical protein DdX_17176 [Ditylenchus destructor]